jgi:hypothetical protein
MEEGNAIHLGPFERYIPNHWNPKEALSTLYVYSVNLKYSRQEVINDKFVSNFTRKIQRKETTTLYACNR